MLGICEEAVLVPMRYLYCFKSAKWPKLKEFVKRKNQMKAWEDLKNDFGQLYLKVMVKDSNKWQNSLLQKTHISMEKQGQDKEND